MNFEYDVVGKIGSMALIRKEDNDIDYNIFSRLSAELRPGMIWVSSGAVSYTHLPLFTASIARSMRWLVMPICRIFPAFLASRRAP